MLLKPMEKIAVVTIMEVMVEAMVKQDKRELNLNLIKKFRLWKDDVWVQLQGVSSLFLII